MRAAEDDEETPGHARAGVGPRGRPQGDRGDRRPTPDPVPAGVLFDVDGTLVDTTYLHTVAWWEACGSPAGCVPMARIHRAIGMGSDRILDHLLGADRDRADDDTMTSAHTALYATYWERLRPLPGAVELLRACAARGLRVVLASSASGRELAALRAALGADDVITAATSADDADPEQARPGHPARRRWRKPACRAERVVFVGDSVWDVIAAGRLDIPCVAVTCGGTSAAELTEAGAAAVYADPAELLAGARASRRSPSWAEPIAKLG